jgi:cysteine synthase
MDDHVSQAIGRPDLVRLGDRLICLRFETMKVLSADAAVAALLDRGVVRRGDTVIDSSSGIYALALALACHRHGLRCHIVGSTTIDRPTAVQLELLGAELEQMPPTSDLRLDQNRRVARVREILAAHPGHHWMRQYHDAVHHLGYRTVAERIAEEVDGPLVLVGGVGSGASTGALATYLRGMERPTTLVGVQPFGSVTFAADHVSDPDIIIAGIGSSIPFGNVDHTLYDAIHWVGFAAARSGSIELLRRHAVFAGLSSGAGFLAAGWERHLDPGATVIVIAADTGARYVDGVFAHHDDAVPFEHLAPHSVLQTDAIAPPWSRMCWRRAPAPRQARFDEAIAAT